MLAGAGLRVHDLVRPRAPIIVPVVLKLAFFPVLLVAIATAFGVEGQELLYLALCAAVPTAMNGYLLARQPAATPNFTPPRPRC